MAIKNNIQITKIEIISQMDAINENLHSLSRLLHDSKLHFGRTYQLPQYKRNRETVDVKNLEIERVRDGYDAVNAACSTFGKFYCQEGKSRKAVLRTPGLIVVDSSYEEINGIVTSINDAKSKIEEAVKGYSDDSEERHKLVHNLYPELNTIQLYRRINLLDPSNGHLKQAGFSWSCRPSVVKITKEQVITKLNYHLAKPFGRFNHISSLAHWQRLVEQEIALVESLPDDLALRLKRPTKLFPLINLKLDEGKTKQLNASMPLLVCQKEPVQKIKDLKDYERKTRLTRSDNTLDGTAIIERIGLHTLLDQQNSA